MTNTFMLAGESDPEEISSAASPKGVYCTTFGGGSVDITSGNFVFSATESYLIEDGKLTRPVRGASLIGNGPEALKYVSMVGNDLKLDEGVGVCVQGRAEHSRGRGHSDREDRPHDGGGHRGVNELEQDRRPTRPQHGRWQLGATGRRMHACRRRGIFRRRAHARSRKPEAGRLARRGNSRAGGPQHRLFAHLRSFARRASRRWCAPRWIWRGSPPKIRTRACPIPRIWARFDADLQLYDDAIAEHGDGLEDRAGAPGGRHGSVRRSAHSQFRRARRSIRTWARGRSRIRAAFPAPIGHRAAGSAWFRWRRATALWSAITGTRRRAERRESRARKRWAGGPRPALCAG